MTSNGLTGNLQPDRDTVMMQQFRDWLESELESGKSASSIDSWIESVPPTRKLDVFAELLRIEIQFRQQRGLDLDREHYLSRFPEYRDQIIAAFEASRESDAKSSNSISMVTTTVRTRVYVPLEAPEKSWSSGQTIGHGGRYRLDQFVGRGGFGEVWKGYDSELDRVIAIKVPRHKASHQPNEALLFRDEARRATKVKHQGIVEIHDVGIVDGGFFIISEFIDGPTLAQRMKAETIPRTEAVRIVQSIALILDKAHVDGLFHRDIKPSNILLRPDGSPVVTDFGLAVSEEEQLTLERGLVGTLVYMSPEQARGENRLLDGRSDLYSLGVILFRLLTGRLPFQFKTENDLLDQIIHREVRPLRSIDDTIPARLDQICLKCLAKDVKQRYATGKDLAADLGEYSTSVETAVSLTSPVVPLAASDDARSTVTGTGWEKASAVVAAILLVGTLWIMNNPKRGSFDQAGSNQGTQGNQSIQPMFAGSLAKGRQRLSLLDEPLDKIIAQRNKETDFLQQDLSKSMLSARSEEAWWILGTRYVGKSPLRMRGRVYLNDWIGSVGFVWGLSRDIDSPDGRFPRCFACLIERFDPTGPFVVCLRDLRTEENSPDVLSIGRIHTLGSNVVPLPKDVPVDLDVIVDDAGVTVKIDSREVWRSNDFPEPSPSEMKDISGSIGVILRGKMIVVTDAVVEFDFKSKERK